MRALLISFYFPPAGGGGVQRTLKLASQLPEFGITMHVLAPDDPKWIHRDEDLPLPTDAVVHRARYFGPRGRIPAEELYGRRGLERLQRQAALTPRRLIIPDENASWALTAVRAATRIVRDSKIDCVITTSPPNSIHLIGAAVQQATGVCWVADLRDALVAKSDRHGDRLAARLREHLQVRVASLVARRADAVVGSTEAIVHELLTINPALRSTVIPNGADYEDFEALEYRPGDRFRITHTGSFFGKRNARPFLEALAGSDECVVARFVGDFRKSDREWVRTLGLGDRLELHPFLPRAKTLELQRNSEALLLLLPEIGERGRDVPSGKLFEYLAARRPILAAVPRDGAAAALVREGEAGILVDPGDVDAIREAIAELVGRWRAGTLELPPEPDGFRARIDRRTRSREYAELLKALV